MSKIQFAEEAWEDYQYWLAHDRGTLKKINNLLKEIQRTPRLKARGSRKP